MGNSSHLLTGSLNGLLNMEVTPEMVCVDGELEEMPEGLAPLAKRLPMKLKDFLARVDAAAGDWKKAHEARLFLEDVIGNLMDDGRGIADWVHTFERTQQNTAFWVDELPNAPASAIMLKWGPTYDDKGAKIPEQALNRSGASALSGYSVYSFEMQEVREAMGYILNHPARRVAGYNEELLQYVIEELASAVGSGTKKGHDILILACQV